MKNISIIKPDDWHVHFRDNDVLKNTVPNTAKYFARALVMPNTIPPLVSLNDLKNYRARILSALPKNSGFEPLMTFYLNNQIELNELIQSKSYHYIVGAKLYPKGATTNSSAGVRSVKNFYPHLEVMQDLGLVLQIHGEVTHGDIFDREKIFIEEELIPILKNFPKLKIVLEHISTKVAVDFMENSSNNVAATITPHHLLYNRNNLLSGGIKPHLYCLPILKRESCQKSLIKAATSGNPKFFAGTDSAPHSKNYKENSCGCAGVYSAPFAVAMYTEVFDKASRLSNLEGFLSKYGATFYNKPILNDRIELIKKSQTIPNYLPLGYDEVIPLAAGENIQWSVI
ncbi:MAG: dihydroorotase [Legionellales bacterium RIFCSPHIGHO2_12_FULL_35_11]|nr:MAG: dihydroorotase [Legionellales bacterium RIFCSPHIGHO2_12_FULL_35_11]